MLCFRTTVESVWVWSPERKIRIEHQILLVPNNRHVTLSHIQRYYFERRDKSDWEMNSRTKRPRAWALPSIDYRLRASQLIKIYWIVVECLQRVKLLPRRKNTLPYTKDTQCKNGRNTSLKRPFTVILHWFTEASDLSSGYFPADDAPSLV